MRSAVAYVSALLAGLCVLWFATPLMVFFGFGFGPVTVSAAVIILGVGMAASILPYIAARLVLRHRGGGGQTVQMLCGSVIAALSVLILDIGLPGPLSPLLFNGRILFGVVLAGAVAGFIHHAIRPSERKTT
ncbi:MAG: hypothetical protein KKB02_02165 [Alphaproteobacteria bacterium]|nr:hypothetical protein [Alphaproteobacteria bacterium]